MEWANIMWTKYATPCALCNTLARHSTNSIHIWEHENGDRSTTLVQGRTPGKRFSKPIFLEFCGRISYSILKWEKIISNLYSEVSMGLHTTCVFISVEIVLVFQSNTYFTPHSSREKSCIRFCYRLINKINVSESKKETKHQFLT